MTKKLNVLQKFNNFIERLESDERELLYLILSALRGPDNPKEVHNFLKEYTTGRIRSFLNIKWLTHYVYISRDALDESRIKMRDDLLNKADSHFVVHYHEAARAIEEICGYDLEKEVKNEVTK